MWDAPPTPKELGPSKCLACEYDLANIPASPVDPAPVQGDTVKVCPECGQSTRASDERECKVTGGWHAMFDREAKRVVRGSSGGSLLMAGALWLWSLDAGRPAPALVVALMFLFLGVVAPAMLVAGGWLLIDAFFVALPSPWLRLRSAMRRFPIIRQRKARLRLHCALATLGLVTLFLLCLLATLVVLMVLGVLSHSNP